MLKHKDPSIMDAMNDAKITPNGNDGKREDPCPAEAAALRPADQKKTKRYIEPSTQVEISPRTSILLSDYD